MANRNIPEKISILQILIENQEEEFSIRKLSQIRKINYKSAYNAIAKLEEEGIITCKKFGNAINCKFNKKFNESVFITEYKRRSDLLKNRNFKIIYNYFKELSFPFIALLFGSHAKQTQTKYSDIDILTITENEKQIEDKFSILPLKIHHISLTPSEFMSMAKSKEFSVVSEALRRNIILIGIEEYYRIIENVR